MKQRLLFFALACVLLLPWSIGGQAQTPATATSAFVDPAGRLWSLDDGIWVLDDGGMPAYSAATWKGRPLVVAKDGRVFRGSSIRGQAIEGLVDIRLITCAPSHCLALDAWGRVFSLTTQGVLLVEGVSDVVDVAAGDVADLAVFEDGSVVSWRADTNASDATERRSRVPGLRDVVAVAAGASSLYALDAEGGVFAWPSMPTKGAERVRRVGGVRARSIAAYADQVWAVTHLGELVSLDSPTVDLMPSESAISVHATGASVVALSADGSVTVLGGVTSRFPGSLFKDRLDRREKDEASPMAVPSLPRALVVTGINSSTIDNAIGARLESLGLSVDYVTDEDTTPAKLRENALVVTSPTARGKKLSAALDQVAVPMLAMDPYSAVRLGLLSERATAWRIEGTDASVVVRGEHPVGAGGDGAYSTTTAADWVSSARPSGADVVAVAPNGLATVFSYSAGSIAEGGPLPAKRLGFFLGHDASEFAAPAWTLFDEAIRWSLGEPPAGSLKPKSSGGSQLGFKAASLTGGSGTILLVVGNTTLSAGDASYKSRMEAMGFTVTTKLASASSAADASGKVLVFVSGSSPNADVLAKFLNVTVPVLIQSSGIVDDMNMTNGANRGSDALATNVTVQNASHAITYPLSGTIAVSTSGQGQTWGIGDTGAQHLLATITNSGHYTLFVYSSGAQMVGMSAPSRRVLYGLSDPVPQTFTTEGLDLFERMIFWATQTNLPPSVTAGPDRAAYEATAITLNGVVVDDGLPASPGTTTKTWSVESAPPGGSVTFGTPSAAVTTATFSTTGAFVVKLQANDGSATVSDTATVNVFLPSSNSPPVVNAGDDAAALTGAAINISATATDDGLAPGSALTYQWTKISGPGSVTFGTGTSLTTSATFGSAGTYVVRFTATEMTGGTPGLSSFDERVVKVSDSVLLVVGNLSLTPAETYLKARFQAAGFPVTTQLASATVANDANGKAFVWVSASSLTADLLDGLGNAKFLNKGQPIVIQQIGIVDDMGMTPTADRGSAATQTQLTVTAPSSWLSAGLSGTFLNSTAASTYDWGIPAGTATKVAGVASANTQSPLFVYEAGAVMSSGLAAPGRRAFVGYDASALTPTGQKLVDQLIFWLGLVNGPPVVNVGADQSIAWSAPSVIANLSGSTTDDGLPVGATLPKKWTAVSGPAAVTFGNDTLLATTATFTAPGDYVLKLTATETVMGAQPVTWTNTVGVSTSGNSITKTAATAAWDAGATSSQSIASGDGYVETVPSSLTYSWAFGLGGNGNSSASWTDIEFCLHGVPSGALYVCESGTLIGQFGTFAPGDILRVAIEGGVVKYRKNGTVIYTSAVSPSGKYPFALDTSLYSTGATIQNGTIFAGSGTSQSVFTGTDFMTVSVVEAAANAAPVVAAGPDRTLRLPSALPLTAMVGDDGLPLSPGAVTVGWSKVTGPGTVAFSPSNAASTSATFSATGQYVIRITANDGALTTTDDVAVNVEASKNALFVVGSLSLDADDAAAKARLESLGFAVTTTTAANPGDATGKDIVMISASVNSVGVAGAMTSVTAPMLVWEQLIFDDMGWTGPEGTHTGMSSVNQVTIDLSGHPLAASLSGQPAIHLTTAGVAWGNPGAAAIKIASVDATKSALFAYEAGTAMYSGTAAGRRVGYGWRPANATSAGLALFDAAVRWLTEPRAPALLVTGSTTLTAADQALVARLSAQRLSVTPITAASLTTGDTTGKALIVVTPTADAVALGTKLKDIQVPVIVANKGASTTTRLSTVPTTATVTGLPTDNSQLYVRLKSFDGTSWMSKDYTYQAFSSAGVPAQMTSPAAGSSLGSSSATLTWNTGTGNSSYWLWIGSTQGGFDIYNATQGASLSVALTGLPTDGRTLYVRLFSYSTVWTFNDYKLKAFAEAIPAMTTPVPGGTLAGASETFNWSAGAGVTKYWLSVGNTVGGTDYYNVDRGTNLSAAVTGLPVDGRQLYVRLAWLKGAVWSQADYTYQASFTGAAAAVLVSPTAGTTLSGSSANFTWTAGTSISEYWLYLGSTKGGTDLYTASQSTSLAASIGGIPTDGRTLYLRLRSRTGATWLHNDYVFTAANTGPVAADMLTPIPGSTFSASSATFTWTAGTGITSYALDIGTTLGGTNVYSGSVGLGDFTGTMTMTGVAHSTGAGLSGAQTIVSDGGALPWLIPAAGAVVVAAPTTPSPASAKALASYEVGAAMTAGHVAPDRRLAFPLNGTSAANLTTSGATLLDAAIRWMLESDRDADGLGIFEEITLGTDPGNGDTNGDGILDGAAVASQMSTTNTDMDGDGLTNALELAKGTDPFNRDTDGDGTIDTECFPLDPSRTSLSCPGAPGGDSTPPTITLTKPVNATQTGTTPP